MIKFLIIFNLLLATIVFSQTDTVDSVLLSNGDILKGKVLRIKPESIEFFESSTSIIYEYENRKINSILFSNGKIINFNKETSASVVDDNTKLEAQEEVTEKVRFAFGPGVLFAFASDNYETNQGGINLFMELRTASLISFEINIGWYSANTKGDYLSQGTASFTLTELSLLFRKMTGAFQPFAGLGFGYYSVENKLDDSVIHLLEQLGLRGRETVEGGLNFHIRAGFDIMLSSHFGLLFDLKYLMFNPTATSTVTEISYPYASGTATAKKNLNNLNLIVGLVIAF